MVSEVVWILIEKKQINAQFVLSKSQQVPH